MTANDEASDVCAEETLSPASYYDGDFLSNCFFSVISFFCRVLTLDIAAPIVICLRLRWRAEHIHINGRRMIFTGKIGNLFAKNALWVLLSVITLGLYLPFKILATAKWKAAHFHFVGVPETEDPAERSELDCKWYLCLWLKLLSFFGNLLTLGLAQFWIYVYKERKLTEHTKIDGHKLEFNATAVGYFKKRVLWQLLTILTLGLYTLRLNGKILRWKIANTAVLSPETLPYSEEVALLQPLHPSNKRAYVCFFLLFPTAIFILGAWFSKVLCMHGPLHPISYVPFAIWLAAVILIILNLVTAGKAFRFSLTAHSAKHLSVSLIVLDALLSAVCAAILVVLVVLMC